MGEPVPDFDPRDPERNKIPRNHLWTATPRVPNSRIGKTAIMRISKDEGKMA